MEQYRIVHAARLQLEDRIRSVGNAAIDSTNASSELQDTMQEPAHDVTDSTIADFIEQLPDIQTLLSSVRELISLSIQVTADMVTKKDLLGDIELALIAQMSKGARKEVEDGLQNPVRRTDCWVKTSRDKKKRKK